MFFLFFLLQCIVTNLVLSKITHFWGKLFQTKNLVVEEKLHFASLCRGMFGVHNIFVKPDLRLKPCSVVIIFF